jgi:hypothetical protein
VSVESVYVIVKFLAILTGVFLLVDIKTVGSVLHEEKTIKKNKI